MMLFAKKQIESKTSIMERKRLKEWSRLLQRLHNEVDSQELKDEILEIISEIDRILSEWVDEEKPPPKKIVNKTRVKASDLIYKAMIKLAEHEVISTVLDKIHHLL